MGKENTAQFLLIAEEAIAREKFRVFSGEIAAMSSKNFEYRVRGTLIPIFGSRLLPEINYLDLVHLNEELARRNLSSISISQYFQDLKKIFNYAIAFNLIEKIPLFPKIKKKSKPRGSFTVGEYRKLIVTARILAKKNDEEKKRNHRFTANGVYAKSDTVPSEMESIIRIMVNGFMRPSDIFQMKHKHVTVVKGEYHYLRLQLPETKRHLEQTVTLRPAVKVYEKIKKESGKKGLSEAEDYLFFPEIENRLTAGRVISMNFNKILNHSGLKKGIRGQMRSLYCLRHTAIMNRLLYGRGIDLLTLARNSRTSVQMIEQFYASELRSEMNVALLQSRRGAKHFGN